MSTITPPVCGTVFIASGMVSENWLKVSLTSMSLGIGLYFIPLAMIANEAIIKLDTDLLSSMTAFVKIALSLVMLSYAFISKNLIIVRMTVFVLALFVMFI